MLMGALTRADALVVVQDVFEMLVKEGDNDDEGRYTGPSHALAWTHGRSDSKQLFPPVFPVWQDAMCMTGSRPCRICWPC